MIPNLLGDVSEEHYFRVRNGRTLKNLVDLRRCLKRLSQENFSFHLNQEKNDFYHWVKDLYHDKELSTAIHNAKTKQDIVTAIDSRLLKVRQKKKLEQLNYIPSADKEDILARLSRLR